jgi:hypothetical protein
MRHLLICLIVTLTCQSAQAGWFAELCERLLLVAPDPTQFDGATDEWLVSAYRYKGLSLINSQKPSLIDRHELRIMGDLMRHRIAEGISKPEMQVQMARELNRYNHQEE